MHFKWHKEKKFRRPLFMFPHKHIFFWRQKQPWVRISLNIHIRTLIYTNFLKSVLHIDSSIWREDGASPMDLASSTWINNFNGSNHYSHLYLNATISFLIQAEMEVEPVQLLEDEKTLEFTIYRLITSTITWCTGEKEKDKRVFQKSV